MNAACTFSWCATCRPFGEAFEDVEHFGDRLPLHDRLTEGVVYGHQISDREGNPGEEPLVFVVAEDTELVMPTEMRLTVDGARRLATLLCKMADMVSPTARVALTSLRDQGAPDAVATLLGELPAYQPDAVGQAEVI